LTSSAFSTFTAISELFVTAGVIYVFTKSYRGLGFPWKLAAGIAVFEFSVNMTYMLIRMSDHTTPGTRSPYAWLAAIHGSLSLLVFAAFVILTFLAYFAHKRGEQYFQQRPKLYWTFLVFWFLSVGSGEAFFIIRYL
jgi:hypothetical protein